MPSIRQEILFHLDHRPGATSAELARALSVSPADIRHHLRKLVGDGLVQSAGTRPSRSAGRPSQVYTLARQGDGLPSLVSTLLALLGQDPESQENLLNQVAETLAGVDRVGSPRPAATTQRLVQAVQRLNQLHYHARWEARAAAPQIILGHCPFAAIIEAHPELCLMDGRLIAHLAGQLATQSVKREPNPQGIPVCVFVFGKR